MEKIKEGYQHEYKMGYDCGLNGSNTTNCHFSLFSNQQKLYAWELGKKAGEKAKANQTSPYK